MMVWIRRIRMFDRRKQAVCTDEHQDMILMAAELEVVQRTISGMNNYVKEIISPAWFSFCAQGVHSH